MDKALRDALESVETTIVTDPRDWSLYKRDAWLWAVLIGWGDALSDVAKAHGWTDSDVARLQRMHAAVKRVLANPDDVPHV